MADIPALHISKIRCGKQSGGGALSAKKKFFPVEFRV